MIRPHARVASHVLLPLLCLPVAGQGDGWRTPPAAIRDCIDAPPAPSASVSPDRSHLLLSAREGMPSLAVQSRPILRLAGLRLDPATHGRQRGARAGDAHFPRGGGRLRGPGAGAVPEWGWSLPLGRGHR